MSAPKRGLGRGLGALLGDDETRPENDLRQIPVAAIRPNPQQPRTNFDAQALVELESSIRELGVLVPIIVRPVGDAGYELIAGERRWRAAAAARLELIPAIVRSADDRASLELAVVENLQRENLDPLEEAMGFAHLIDEYDFTQERLAERLGRSRPAVANALRLLGLSDPIKAALRAGSMSAGHARALLAVPVEERDDVARRTVRDGWTVRDVERWAARRANPAPAKPTHPNDANLAAVEQRLRYRFGAKVRIVKSGRAGRVELRFADEPDLMRIVDLLLDQSE
ncbi:MAG: ParB/RepB/Spo0J family partition protein [Vulcanimicrobiaceae bacterium]